jgi:hypothetical protein
MIIQWNQQLGLGIWNSDDKETMSKEKQKQNYYNHP